MSQEIVKFAEYSQKYPTQLCPAVTNLAVTLDITQHLHIVCLVNSYLQVIK